MKKRNKPILVAKKRSSLESCWNSFIPSEPKRHYAERNPLPSAMCPILIKLAAQTNSWLALTAPSLRFAAPSFRLALTSSSLWLTCSSPSLRLTCSSSPFRLACSSLSLWLATFWFGVLPLVVLWTNGSVKLSSTFILDWLSFGRQIITPTGWLV